MLALATALVTGAGSGIGRAVALELAGRGASLVLVGRRRDPLEAVASAIAAAPPASKPRVETCDVSLADDVARLGAALGPIDVAVLAAGTAAAAPVHELPVEAFDGVVATNLRGAFLLCRALLPGMRMRRRGIIVTVSSVAARRAFPGMGAYGASKAALSALGAVVRAENRDHGVRVLDVIVGATSTPIWDTIWPDAPRARMMSPEEVARAIAGALALDGGAMVEELVVRPQGGDL